MNIIIPLNVARFHKIIMRIVILYGPIQFFLSDIVMWYGDINKNNFKL